MDEMNQSSTKIIAIPCSDRNKRFIDSQVAIHNTLADAEIQVTVASYGYSVENIHAGKAICEAANRSQEQSKGAAQQATRDQDAALLELKTWYQQHIKIARVALQGKKELLEKLGIRMLSSKTPAQRGGKSRSDPRRKKNNVIAH